MMRKKNPIFKGPEMTPHSLAHLMRAEQPIRSEPSARIKGRHLADLAQAQLLEVLGLSGIRVTPESFKDRYDPAYWALAACVRHSTKARRKIRNHYNNLPEHPALNPISPPAVPLNCGIVQLDEDTFKAMCVYSYEQNHAPERSGEDYSLERLQWLEQAYPRTLEICTVAFPVVMASYRMFMRNVSGGPVATEALLHCLDKNTEAALTRLSTNDGISYASTSVMTMLLLLMMDLDNLRELDKVVPILFAAMRITFGENGERSLHELVSLENWKEIVEKARTWMNSRKKTPIFEKSGLIDVSDESTLIDINTARVVHFISRENDMSINFRAAIETLDVSKTDIGLAYLMDHYFTPSKNISVETKESINVTLYLCLLVLFNHIKELKKLLSDKTNPPPQNSQLDEDAAALADQQAEVERELRARIKTLEAENVRLQDMNNAAARETETHLKTIRTLQEEVDTFTEKKRELNDLREMVYTLTNESDGVAAVVEEDAVNLPYTEDIPGMIVVGGHDNWVNNMQARFPNIRFIGNSKTADRIIFKKASCIIFQTSFLAHSSYGRALEDARTFNVPVYYLPSQSLIQNTKKIIEICESLRLSTSE